MAEELSIERLVAGPTLSGPSIQGLKVSPDGKRITFCGAKRKMRRNWTFGNLISNRANQIYWLTQTFF
ncbi:MAG: hypothetical protein JKY34_07125 [Kordiimonadaceae bacterium]|nr:hypothetical protein [Kordiimonadaceae bacterium]